MMEFGGLPMSDTYTLYGGKASYFTGKLRSYLIHKQIRYNEILSTFEVMRDVILPRTGLHMIPVVQTPEDEVLQDTTVIIDELEKRFPQNSVYPESPRQKLISLLLECYGDEWLVYPAMHYRWSFPQNWFYILKEFGGILTPNMPEYMQALGGIPPALFFGLGHRPALGISFKLHKPIEEMTVELFETLNEHFKNHDFLFGSRASIGDYGLMGPLYAHLYLDPVPGKIMRDTAPYLVRWVERMNRPLPENNQFLPEDEVPSSLFPVLKRLFGEHVSALLNLMDKTDQWAKKNPRSKVPRFIGMQDFKIGGVKSKRAVQPYSQWMFQRPLDFYHSLNNQKSDDKKSVDDLLRQLGGYESMQYELNTRLTKQNNLIIIGS